MRFVAAGELPFLAKHFARADRHDQDRGHAARVRHFKIARKILENRSPRRVDIVACEKAVIDDRARLRLELG
jgi:hypothetical protein